MTIQKIKLISLFITGALLLGGCSKKDRLTVDTFELHLFPTTSSVLPGGSVTITVSGSTGTRTEFGVVVAWYVSPAGMGTLSNATGVSTVFTASDSAYGTVKVIAMYNGFVSETEVGVGVVDVVNDVNAAGYIGVFTDPGVTATTLELSDDTVYFQEGLRSTKAAFNVPAASWGAGWYVFAGDDSTGVDRRDMSAYSGGNLRFWVKTPVDLEIKIEDGIISAVKQLSTLGAYTDDEWHEVTIPISDFSGVDLSSIKSLFTISVLSTAGYNDNAALSGSYYVDNARWTIK